MINVLSFMAFISLLSTFFLYHLNIFCKSKLYGLDTLISTKSLGDEFRFSLQTQCMSPIWKYKFIIPNSAFSLYAFALFAEPFQQ